MIILKRNRKAFSMMVSLVVIVAMSALAILVSNITGKMSKETATMYQKEQAILLGKSYTEYAIMAVSANDRITSDCLEHINGSVGVDPDNGYGYRINTVISYIGNSGVDSCDRIFSNAVTDTESELSVVIDVYVRYREMDQQNKSTAPWITYHKRSLQKI